MLKIKYPLLPSYKAANAKRDVLVEACAAAAARLATARDEFEGMRAGGSTAHDIQTAVRRIEAHQAHYHRLHSEADDASRYARVVGRCVRAVRHTIITTSLAKTMQRILEPKWGLPLPDSGPFMIEAEARKVFEEDPRNSTLTTVSWRGALASVLVLRVPHDPDADHPFTWASNELYVVEDRVCKKVRSPTAAFREVHRILKEQLHGFETTKPSRRRS